MDMKDYGKMIRSITSNANYFIGSKIEKYGVRQGQFEYFLLIYSSPGINQLELARLKNVGKASVTKALKILENDGFIRRGPDEQDKRNTLCYITEKGKRIVDSLMHVKLFAQEQLFKGFNEDEKLVFYRYLSLLHRNSEELVSDINFETDKK